MTWGTPATASRLQSRVCLDRLYLIMLISNYFVDYYIIVARSITTITALSLSPMDPSQNYYSQYSQQQSAYDVNPYHQPYNGPMYPIGGSSSAHSAPVPANAYEYDVGILAQQSVYVPGAMIDKRGGAGGKLAKGGKRTTVLRKGGGKVWEDQTLLEWNPCRFCLCFLVSLPLTVFQPGFACSSET